jgi:hypothetical protein
LLVFHVYYSMIMRVNSNTSITFTIVDNVEYVRLDESKLQITVEVSDTTMLK